MATLSLKILFASTVLAAVPSVAAAQSGVEIGVRTGYAFAAGHTGAVANSSDRNLGDEISGQWPIWLDAGYRFNPNWYLGGYFQYGVGFVNEDQKTACRNANVDCSAADIRLGVMGRYHFVPGSQFSPWLGLGFGYERVSFSVHESVLSSTTDSRGSGVEFANLQVGADYHIASCFVIGPFLSLSLGEYLDTSTTISRGSSSSTTDQEIAKESVHEWILIGVRAAFTP